MSERTIVSKTTKKAGIFKWLALREEEGDSFRKQRGRMVLLRPLFSSPPVPCFFVLAKDPPKKDLW